MESGRETTKEEGFPLMAFKNVPFLLSLSALFLLFTTSESTTRFRFRKPASFWFSSGGSDPLQAIAAPPPPPQQTPLGEWALLQKSIGVSAMHMQLMKDSTVVIFDRTDFGISNLSLPKGKCRYNDAVVKVDCSAHSLQYDVASNTYRPLAVQTNLWCSSGSVHPDGTLVQTGGYRAGERRIRVFTPCDGLNNCDWVELPEILSVRRWYASNHILPDGRVIVVGGRRQYNYEYFPKSMINGSASTGLYSLPFLAQTADKYEENNLYPFLHLLPDGNLYIFANRRSILLDYVHNRIVREFPPIPGEKRNYPSTGSSLLLPLRGTLPVAEVMICGGSPNLAFFRAEKQKEFLPASKTCGRMKLTDPNPKWLMENMPMNRVMPDMMLLPTGDVIIINGASNGTAGWEDAVGPVLHPLLYYPKQPDLTKRFSVLNPSTIPRLYHSSAILLPDGRILVGGSNPHAKYDFNAKPYRTELSLEAFSPPYLAPQYSDLRPSIISIDDPDKIVLYGQQFSLTITVPTGLPDQELNVALMAPPFATHSFQMNQRMIYLDVVDGIQELSGYRVTVVAPATRNIAPPGYYLLFVVHGGIPGESAWIKVNDDRD